MFAARQPSRERKAPVDRLKVAIVGTGGVAGVHARVFKDRPDVQIVAGCDVSEEIVNGFWDRNLEGYEPRAAAYADAAKMYAECSPDAVAICSPHTLHFEQGMQALEAGCHVLMEKPMVTSAEHAYTLEEKVEAAGKTLVIGYNTACSPYFKYLREQVRAGTFGKLELVQGYLSQNWLRGTKGKWRQDPKLSGGGQAYDSGAHLLNSLCWTVESPVEKVFALVDNHGTEVDINSVMSVRFENGVLANFTIGGNSPGGGTYTVFVFDEGRVEIDGWGAGWIRVYGGDGKQIEDPPIEGEKLAVAANFIDAVMGRDEPRTNPRHGVIQTELMDAIYESQRTGLPATPKRRS